MFSNMSKGDIQSLSIKMSLVSKVNVLEHTLNKLFYC